MKYEYAKHILQIKLWEWEGIKEKWANEMTKDGPSDEAARAHTIANSHITELKDAIRILENEIPIQ